MKRFQGMTMWLLLGLVCGMFGVLGANYTVSANANSYELTTEDTKSSSATLGGTQTETNKTDSDKASVKSEGEQNDGTNDSLTVESKKSEFPAEQTSSGFSFLGISILSGLTQQPEDQNILVTDSTLTINASLAPYHVINTTMSLVLPATQHNWELYMSTDDINYKKVDEKVTKSLIFATQTYDKTFTLKQLGIQSKGTYYFQLKVRTPFIFDIGKHSYQNFYSRPFKIQVVQDEIKATNLSIDQGKKGEMLKDDEKQLSATLIPKDSTDKISWESANPDIASIDEKKGIIKSHKYGSTWITAYAKDRADHLDAIATYELQVIGGLDDISVEAGSDATFNLKGMSDAALYETTWYQQQSEQQNPKQDVVLTTNANQTIHQNQLVLHNVPKSKNNSKYYVKIQLYIDVHDGQGDGVTHKPIGEPFYTNTATLTVNDGPAKLSHAGDFQFGTIKLGSNVKNKYFPTEQKIVVENSAKHNWQLMAHQTTVLKDSQGVEIPVYFNDQKINTELMKIADQHDKNVQHVERNDILLFPRNEGFNLRIPSNVHIGQYQSEMSWQLLDTPIT